MPRNQSKNKLHLMMAGVLMGAILQAGCLNAYLASKDGIKGKKAQEMIDNALALTMGFSIGRFLIRPQLSEGSYYNKAQVDTCVSGLMALTYQFVGSDATSLTKLATSSALLSTDGGACDLKPLDQNYLGLEDEPDAGAAVALAYLLQPSSGVCPARNFAIRFTNSTGGTRNYTLYASTGLCASGSTYTISNVPVGTTGYTCIPAVGQSTLGTVSLGIVSDMSTTCISLFSGSSSSFTTHTSNTITHTATTTYSTSSP